MIESTAYDLIKEEGVKEGLQQGLQQGIEQGIEQGLQQGIQQGLQRGLEQGLEQGLRQGILDNLEARFGTAPRSVAGFLDNIRNIQHLRTLHRKSSTVPSLKEFEETLAQITQTE